MTAIIARERVNLAFLCFETRILDADFLPTLALENLISNEINIGELKDGLLDPEIDIADYFD